MEAPFLQAALGSALPFTPQFLFVVKWENKKPQIMEALGMRAPHHPACASPQVPAGAAYHPMLLTGQILGVRDSSLQHFLPSELPSVALQLPTHPLTPACRWRKVLLSKKTSMSSAGP